MTENMFVVVNHNGLKFLAETKTNYMLPIVDVHIIDKQGVEYDISNILIEGNDVMYIVIKEDYENYISNFTARELIDTLREEKK